MKSTQTIIGLVIGIFFSFSTISFAKSFPDVSATDWFFDYVQKIEQWGLISGNDDGTFAPGRAVVRAELAKMFVLLDERTDTKIQNSEASSQLALNERFKQLEEEAIATPLPTIMQLKKRNNPAAACPQNWSEVDAGFVGNDDARINTRTCMTYDQCETLTVTQHTNNAPKSCPAGWLEASYGLVEKQDMERVCYICVD